MMTRPVASTVRAPEGTGVLAAGPIAAIRSDLLTPDTPVPVTTEGLSTTDAFFRARDRFHLFRTCNTWISRKLREAGVEMGLWTPLTWSVSLSYSLWQAPD
jgi:hypothetical protein